MCHSQVVERQSHGAITGVTTKLSSDSLIPLLPVTDVQVTWTGIALAPSGTKNETCVQGRGAIMAVVPITVPPKYFVSKQ